MNGVEDRSSVTESLLRLASGLNKGGDEIGRLLRVASSEQDPPLSSGLDNLHSAVMRGRLDAVKRIVAKSSTKVCCRMVVETES